MIFFFLKKINSPIAFYRYSVDNQLSQQQAIAYNIELFNFLIESFKNFR